MSVYAFGTKINSVNYINDGSLTFLVNCTGYFTGEGVIDNSGLGTPNGVDFFSISTVVNPSVDSQASVTEHMIQDIIALGTLRGYSISSSDIILPAWTKLS